MTEAEWLSSQDPAAMLAHIQGKVSGRKLRLFACACGRACWGLLTDERSRRAVEVAELFADGLATLAELDAAHSAAYDAWATGLPMSSPAGMARFTCVSGDFMRAALAICPPGLSDVDAAARAALLREIVGNPWNHYYIEEDYTPTVLSLARAAYEERPRSVCPRCSGNKTNRVAVDRAYTKFQDIPCSDCGGTGTGTGTLDDGTLDPLRLAILADALEDAGRADATTLSHLHSAGPHVRGCWALDLLLGKE